jgi:acetyltransferase-like isoleucine patch superfamily enzyme
MGKRSKLKILCNECKSTGTNVVIVLFKTLVYKLKGKNIIAHHRTLIKGLANIYTSDKVLKIGLHNVGFTNASDRTFLNIKGKLVINGNYTITQGCRLYIGQNATLQIGDGGYVNANCNFIIMHGLKIGNECIIAWNCQFLDEDYHTIEYKDKQESTNKIIIGNRVWIGCHVFIYKGVQIADGCIVAANSVVRTSFTEKNVLIGGNPARILKRDVYWK